MKKDKRLKIVILALLIIILIFGFFVFVTKDTRKITNDIYSNIQSNNEYEEQFPIGDYVDESLNQSAIIRNKLIAGMSQFDYDMGFNIQTIFTLVLGTIFDFHNYNNEVYKYQVEETKPLSIDIESEENYITFNNKNQQSVEYTEGEVELVMYQSDGGFKLGLSENSYLQNRGSVAKLLADDSNAEYLTYFIIEKLQQDNSTIVDPNSFSKQNFGSSFDELAGSISYHSILFLLADNDSDLFDKVSQINIAQNDSDSFLVNQKY